MILNGSKPMGWRKLIQWKEKFWSGHRRECNRRTWVSYHDKPNKPVDDATAEAAYTGSPGTQSNQETPKGLFLKSRFSWKCDMSSQCTKWKDIIWAHEENSISVSQVCLFNTWAVFCSTRHTCDGDYRCKERKTSAPTSSPWWLQFSSLQLESSSWRI